MIGAPTLRSSFRCETSLSCKGAKSLRAFLRRKGAEERVRRRRAFALRTQGSLSDPVLPVRFSRVPQRKLHSSSLGVNGVPKNGRQTMFAETKGLDWDPT